MKNVLNQNTRSQVVALQESLNQAAEAAIETAKRLGADDCKVVTGTSQTQRLVAENKDFSLADTVGSQSLSLSVHKNKRRGSASINSTNPERIEKAIRDSLGVAAFSIPDEYLYHPDTKEAPPAPSLGFLFDPEIEALSMTELRDATAEALIVVRQDKRVAIDRLEVTASTSASGLANSKGVRQGQSQTVVSWSFLGMAVDGDEVTGMDYDSGFSYASSGFQSVMLGQIEEFCRDIVTYLNPRQCPSYRGLVLLSPRAVEELLLDFILYHVSGRSVMDGKSRWAEKVGEAVVAPRLTIRDVPHERAHSGATSYDGDGLPTSARTLIDAGVLKAHLLDCYSANRLGKKSNAMAGGPFALEVDPGTKSFSELVAAAPRVLLVNRFSGNTDPIVGEFSGVAKGSRLYENGRDVGPVRETMISGNFFDLAKNIVDCSSTRRMCGTNFLAPHILWDGVSVSGS